jgi:hypothetical protein
LNGYPEKTCTIDRLVTHARLVQKALGGEKTQQRRNGVYAYPGETFELEGVAFEVTRVEHVPLGAMTEEDARAEGFDGLDAYRDLILRMHAGMAWNPEALVWVHEFKRAEGYR